MTSILENEECNYEEKKPENQAAGAVRGADPGGAVGLRHPGLFHGPGTARNVITTGDIKIALEERMLTPDGEKTVPFENQLGVMPGSDVSKIVTVTNTGGQPAWVRVSLDKAIELARGVEGEADLSLVTCDLNTESWTEKDGYYYYNAALEPGQTTEPLFTAVHFAETMSNMYQESRAILQVNAFATQTAHNGASALDAAGWPEA